MAPVRDKIEAEALRLSVVDRAALAQRLIESLDAPDVGDFDPEWIEEAERRYAEFRQGSVTGRPAEQVFRSAKARLE